MFESPDNGGVLFAVKMTEHKLCMIPGPIEFHEDVLSAMSTPGTSHIDPSFINVFGESLKLLRQVFLTEKGQPFIISGSGTLGWDAVVCNLVDAGEEVLVVNTGYFGDHFGECAEAYGYKVTHVNSPQLGDVPSMDVIKSALEEKVKEGKPYKLVNITHVDTSTGVLTDIKQISELIHAVSPSSLVSIDGVCSVGAEELRMDEWKIDTVVTASQKALGCPSGLCVTIFSERAMNALATRKSRVPNYFANLNKWLPIMKAYEEGRPSYFATPAVSLIIALNASLKQIVAGGMDARFKAHQEVSQTFKDTVESWGLRLVPVNRQIAANSMTAIYYPEGIQAQDILPRIVQSGVVVAGGLHPKMNTKYFRIGHMGISAVEGRRGHVTKTLDVLRQVLTTLKYKFK